MRNIITTVVERLEITNPSRIENADYFLMHDAETGKVSAVPEAAVLSKVNNRIDGVIYPDGFTKTGTIQRVGNEISITAEEFAWRIELNPYTNIAAFYKTLDATASGELKRIDTLTVTADNTIKYYKGQEDEFIIKPPKISNKELKLTDITIFGDTVQEHTDPIVGEAFVTKLESQDFVANYGATLVIDKIDLIDDRSSISLIGSATDVKSVQLSGEFIRPGKPHFFKNRTGHNVKLWHLAGTGNIKYFFPNSLDLIVKPNEVVEFNTNANDSSAVRYEYVGAVADLTNYYNKSEVDSVTTLVQIEVSGNQTAQESWKGKDVTFTGSGTLTIPNGLSDQHSFNLYADTGVTIAWSITTPKTWRVAGLAVGTAPPSVTAGQFCMVSARIGTNEIRVLGL